MNQTVLEPIAKFLPAAALEIFRKAADEAESAGQAHNDCIRAGWAATKDAGWQAPPTGKKWVMVKSEPSGGDVHVTVPLGDDGKKKKPKPGDEFESGCAKVLKVDDGLGLVFGWAIVCKQDGTDYFDTQGDHIPEDSMMSALTDFMQHSRVAKDMHQGEEIGPIVFAWPMTADIAKAMGIETKTTGAMIAMKPPAAILAKFRNGDYTGFSIGGSRIKDEEVAT
jgi:hypothetical protein